MLPQLAEAISTCTSVKVCKMRLNEWLQKNDLTCSISFKIELHDNAILKTNLVDRVG